MAEYLFILRQRPGQPLETDAICLHHGAVSDVRFGDAVFTADEAKEMAPDFHDGLKCDLCGHWIIEPHRPAAVPS